MKTDNYKAKKLDEIKQTHIYVEQLADTFDCFMSDCENDSIASHSISKSRILNSLTSNKSEKLFMIDDKYSSDYTHGKMSTFQARNRELNQVSQASASTFKGFCSKCDPELFKDLDENEYSNTPEINFLHLLRAYAFKIRSDRKTFQYIKEETPESIDPIKDYLNTAKEKIDVLSPLIDMLDSFPQDCPIGWEMVSSFMTDHKGKLGALSIINPTLSSTEEYIRIHSLPIFNEKKYPLPLGDFKGMYFEVKSFINDVRNEFEGDKTSGKFDLLKEHVLEVLNHQKEVSDELTQCLRNKSYSNLQSVTHSINGIYSIAGNFVFHNSENEEVVLTFFPELETNKTIFIFSVWNPNSSQDIYLKRINILDQPTLKQFVSNIILSQGTNIYMSKNYLETLEPKEKEVLQQIKVLKSLLTFNLFK